MPLRLLLISAAVFVLMLAAYAWQAWWYLRKRRLRQKMADEGRLPPKAPKRKGDVASKVFGGVLIALAVVAVWAEQRYGVKLMTPRNMVAGGAVLFVVVFVFLTVRDRRNRDPAVAEALRLEKQGDVDGAVGRLRAAMAEAATAERAGSLGALLYRCERWDEAADAFGKAGRLDPQNPMYPVLLAIAQCRGGRNEEALAVARAARAAAPHESAHAAAEALALAGLGRADEAAEQLRQSDELAVVAERDQRVDWGTRLSLGVACREALKAAGSGRAFPVIAEAPRAGADTNPAT